MPLAKQSGGIAGVLQGTGKARMRWGQAQVLVVFRRADHVFEAGPVLIASGHERGASRSADRCSRVALGETHTLSRQPIGIRSSSILRAIDVEVCVAEV